MKNAILVLNSGSSSIKFKIFLQEGLVSTYSGSAERLREDEPFVKIKDQDKNVILDTNLEAGADHGTALDLIINTIQKKLQEEDTKLIFVGHRVVHGGDKFTKPVILDNKIIDELEELTPLAPLHQPHHVVGMRYITKNYPDLKQVACFDTSFHSTNPESIQTYALPRKYWDMGIKRYGFHGLSYDYISRKLPEIDSKARKTIVCHIGNGASMCSIKDGKSIASTMGFTALDGLPMGTRIGPLDAGVTLYLLNNLHMSPKELENLLYKQSGLLGLSGMSNDLRDLEESDEPLAKLAMEHYIMTIARRVGGLASTMGGLDSIVFTAGGGERSPILRREVCKKIEWLGVKIDEELNDCRSVIRKISTEDSSIPVYIIPTNEELMIAKYTSELLG